MRHSRLNRWLVVLSILILASLSISNVSNSHAQQTFSVNSLSNPSFENSLTSWIVDTYNDGNAGSTITANSTRSVTGSSSARLEVSTNATANNPNNISPITFGHITLYQQAASTIYFDNLTNRPDNFNLWVYIEPKTVGAAGYSLVEFRIKATDTTELDYFYINPSLSNIISFQNMTSGGENNKPVKEIILPSPPLNQWVHLQRNLKQDWTAPMTLPGGQTAPGFNLTETLSQTMLEAMFFKNSSGTYAETEWIDDVGFFVDSTSQTPPAASNYWMGFNFVDRKGNPVNNLVKWRLFNSTGGEVTGYTQNSTSLPLEPYTLEVYYPTITGQNPEPYRIARQKISLNTTSLVHLEMMPLGSSGKYIAFNSTLNSLSILENSATKISFNASGSGPSLIILQVPARPLYVERDGTTLSDSEWAYKSTTGTVAIQSASLGSFSIVFSNNSTIPVTYLIAGIGAAIIAATGIIVWRTKKTRSTNPNKIRTRENSRTKERLKPKNRNPPSR